PGYGGGYGVGYVAYPNKKGKFLDFVGGIIDKKQKIATGILQKIAYKLDHIGKVIGSKHKVIVKPPLKPIKPDIIEQKPDFYEPPYKPEIIVEKPDFYKPDFKPEIHVQKPFKPDYDFEVEYKPEIPIKKPIFKPEIVVQKPIKPDYDPDYKPFKPEFEYKPEIPIKEPDFKPMIRPDIIFEDKPYPPFNPHHKPMIKPEIIVDKPDYKPDIIDQKPDFKPDIIEQKPGYKPEISIQEKPYIKPDLIDQKPDFKPDIIDQKPDIKPDIVEQKPGYQPEISLHEKPYHKPDLIDEKPDYKPEIIEQKPGYKPDVPLEPKPDYKLPGEPLPGKSPIKPNFDDSGPELFKPVKEPVMESRPKPVISDEMKMEMKRVPSKEDIATDYYEQPKKKSKFEDLKATVKDATLALKVGSKHALSHIFRKLSVKFGKFADKLDAHKVDYKPDYEEKPDYKPDYEEVKPILKPDEKEEFKPDLKPDYKEELKPDYKPDYKEEVVKEEVKEDDYKPDYPDAQKKPPTNEKETEEAIDERKKEKRLKRQVDKNVIQSLTEKMLHLNKEYANAINHLKLQDSLVDDVKISKQISDRIEHLEKASKIVDGILIFLKTTANDPKRKQEDLLYLEKLYDVELKRIESAKSFNVDKKGFETNEPNLNLDSRTKPTLPDEPKVRPNELEVSTPSKSGNKNTIEEFEEP
ncbi:pneumococcal surface protein C-like protein, partial [Leptotrombidium deliense]